MTKFLIKIKLESQSKCLITNRRQKISSIIQADRSTIIIEHRIYNLINLEEYPEIIATIMALEEVVCFLEKVQDMTPKIKAWNQI